MPAILQEWEDFAATIYPDSAEADTGELRDHAEAMLKTIAADMDTPQAKQQSIKKSRGKADASAQVDTAAQTHAITRLAAGFSIDQLMAEYRALRASVLRLWACDKHASGPIEADGMIRFNEAIDQALSESVARYSLMIRESQNLFLAIIGHDVRTPIGAIGMGAQVLLRDEATPVKTLKVAARILNSAKRIDDIVGDLLDFSMSYTGEGIPISPASTDLAVTCQNLVDEARTFYPEHLIELDLAGDLEANVDEARISQALSNLIANAVQHGSADTPISVLVRNRKDGINWSIHNEGAPISRTNLQMIFDPVRRYAIETSALPHNNPHRHLGLGLFITREIVKAHGGSIQAASSAVSGTTFTIRLPVVSHA